MWREMIRNFIAQLSEVDLFLQSLGVFLLSFIPFVESPGGAAVGSLVGVPMLLAAGTSMVGNWISIMLIISPFDALLTKLRKRKSNKDGFIQKRANKARERYDNYGVPGLALLSPLVASAHIAAFTSLAAGANKKKVILWHTFSIVFWGIIGAAFGGYIHYDIMH